MFKTLNDRGLPLTVVERAKALLVYYSSLSLGARQWKAPGPDGQP